MPHTVTDMSIVELCREPLHRRSQRARNTKRPVPKVQFREEIFSAIAVGCRYSVGRRARLPVDIQNLCVDEFSHAQFAPEVVESAGDFGELFVGEVDKIFVSRAGVVAVDCESVHVECVPGLESLVACRAFEARDPLVQRHGRRGGGGGPLPRAATLLLLAPVGTVVAVDARGASASQLLPLDNHPFHFLGLDFSLDFLCFDFCNKESALQLIANV